ncbi:hypothetical protein EJ06DRAFT_28756 [Trichodelitschia bisporula]|uniref:4Fe-4S ferredoxin-type domain-containing protein n=1 Tax=Trichodelitschia bisporula TaxID=703511 RepID=A0A6G1IC02_9PEZI|nr:hypothetical protein EJ06DRAFT_28756 [Trichodelitschia bisporula]
MAPLSTFLLNDTLSKIEYDCYQCDSRQRLVSEKNAFYRCTKCREPPSSKATFISFNAKEVHELIHRLPADVQLWHHHLWVCCNCGKAGYVSPEPESSMRWWMTAKASTPSLWYVNLTKEGCIACGHACCKMCPCFEGPRRYARHRPNRLDLAGLKFPQLAVSIPQAESSLEESHEVGLDTRSRFKAVMARLEQARSAGKRHVRPGLNWAVPTFGKGRQSMDPASMASESLSTPASTKATSSEDSCGSSEKSVVVFMDTNYEVVKLPAVRADGFF